MNEIILLQNAFSTRIAFSRHRKHAAGHAAVYIYKHLASWDSVDMTNMVFK